MYNINKVFLEGVLITNAKKTPKAIMFLLKSQKGKHTNFFSVVWLNPPASEDFVKSLTKGKTVIISGTIATEEGKVVIFADDVQKRYIQSTQFVNGEKKQTIAEEETEINVKAEDIPWPYMRDIFESN
jgi:single-stranded DNA-binding protein